MKNFLTASYAKLRSWSTGIAHYAVAHKIISGVVALAIIGAGWWGYSAYAASKTTTQYSLSAATNQPIAVTVTGSGTVSAEHQLDLAPKASGTLTSVLVHPGDTVVAGQLIATVDSTDAQKSLRDARTSLESARISYESSLSNANNSITNSQNSLASATGGAFDTLVKTFGDLPTIMSGLKSSLYDTNTLSNYVDLVKSVDPSIVGTRAQVDASYASALVSYNQTLALYQATNRTASASDLLALLTSSHDTLSKVTGATKDALTFMNQVQTDISIHNGISRPSALTGTITTFGTYSSTATGDASSVLSAGSSITTAQQSASQSTASINGSATLDQEAAQLNLQKAQNSYDDAVTALANYTVRAPFPGTIASVSLQKFDTASSGGKVATLITKQQYVNLSMNETDISSIAVGQPATLTFDAITGLSVQGSVAEVDQIGTVSQNVTNYTVKIGFDANDARIKPGMTAEATITTASKDSALVIPLSALKSATNGNGTQYYVEVATASSTGMIGGYGGNRPASTTGAAGGGRAFGTASSTGTYPGTSTTTPRTPRSVTIDANAVTITRVPVTIGLQSDTTVEITSGLTAGQRVVTASLNATGKSTAQSKSLFSLFGASPRTGAGGGAGGGVRTTGATGSGAARNSGGAATRVGG